MENNKVIALVSLVIGYIAATALLFIVFPGNQQVWYLFEILAVLTAAVFYLTGSAIGVLIAAAAGLASAPINTDAIINYVLLAFVVGIVGWLASNNKAQEERLSRLLMIDRLTGLHNYSYFIDRLEEERKRADRFGSRIALIMIDVDHFKNFNEEHSHQEGNELLRDLAATIKTQVRGVDIVSRYGGEEFAVLLPNTGRMASEEIAERIRMAVEEKDSSADDKCTVSIGVAVYPDNASDDLQLIDRADEALSEAKESGRNRVVIFGAAKTKQKTATK